MEKILLDVDATFGLISSIPVSGDAVDLMAAARNNLRIIRAELKKLSEEIKKSSEESKKNDG